MYEAGPVPVVAVTVILQSPGRPWLGQASSPVSSLLWPTASPSFFPKLMKRKKLRETDLEPVRLSTCPQSPVNLASSLLRKLQSPRPPHRLVLPCACTCSGQSRAMSGLELS